MGGLTVQEETRDGNKIMASVHPALSLAARQWAKPVMPITSMHSPTTLARLRVLYGIFHFTEKRRESERTSLSRTVELLVNGAKV